MWSKARNNNHTQSEQWITNISIRRNQNCTKAKATQAVYYLNSESLSPKEALWTVQLHIKNCHKYTHYTNTHKNNRATFWKRHHESYAKTITEQPESIKLSKTLHDHDLVEQAYSHSWQPDCYIRGLRSDECEWYVTPEGNSFPCVMAHKWKRRKLGKIRGRWKTYQISHNGATDSSMYL